MKNISALIGIVIALASCADDESILNNEDLIFTNSLPWNVLPYEYESAQGHLYFVAGDSGVIMNIPDTLNSLPVLAWDSINIPLITAAVFTDKIIVKEGNITNTEDIIWQWHSGLHSVYKNGLQRVAYLDGRKVNGGEIDNNSLPDPLPEGKYYWAVWGWGSSGVYILYSSRELNFYVRN